MGNYLYGVIAAAVFVAILCAAAPENEGIHRFIAFAGALTVALTALSPLSGAAEDWSSNFGEGFFGEPLQSANESADSAQYFAYTVALTVSQLYDTALAEIGVTVYPALSETDAAGPIELWLPAEKKADFQTISETVTELFSCPVTVRAKE